MNRESRPSGSDELGVGRELGAVAVDQLRAAAALAPLGQRADEIAHRPVGLVELHLGRADDAGAQRVTLGLQQYVASGVDEAHA